MKTMFKGYALVMLSAIIYGCMPMGAKIIYANGVNQLSLVLYRNLLFLPLPLIILKLRGESLSITPKQELRILPIALVGMVATPLVLFVCYQYISTGMAAILHFVYPAFVVLGSALFLKEKPTLSRIVCVAMCVVGAGLFSSPDGSFHLLGCSLALLSAVGMAAYALLLTKLRVPEFTPTKYCFFLCLNASAIAFVVCLVTGQLTVPDSAQGWLICLIFSLCISYGAVNCFQQGAHIIGAQRASILSTFEPVTSLVIGVALFNESFSPLALVGAALIIGATALVAVSDLRQNKA